MTNGDNTTEPALTVWIRRHGPYSRYYVGVSDLCVGMGSREACVALRDELRASPRKMRIVYNLFVNKGIKDE